VLSLYINIVLREMHGANIGGLVERLVKSPMKTFQDGYKEIYENNNWISCFGYSLLGE